MSIILICLAPAVAGVSFGNENAAGSAIAEPSEYPFHRGDLELGASLGYGWGFEVGRPNPELEDVEIFSLAPRVGIATFDPWGAGRWWEVSSQVFAEGTFIWQLAPESGTALGAGVMFRFNALALLSSTRLVPFFSIGGGVVSLDFDLMDQDDGVSYTPQLGVGLRYMLGRRASIELEWRYHHISNANSHPPNHGINTNLFSLGSSVFF